MKKFINCPKRIKKIYVTNYTTCFEIIKNWIQINNFYSYQSNALSLNYKNYNEKNHLYFHFNQMKYLQANCFNLISN